MKVYVVGSMTHYADFLENVELVDSIKEANVILFTGGEDVSPSLYGCNKHPKTYNNLERDLREKEIFKKIKPTQVCLGICRGSQFLCVMNGGLLVQDVDRHTLYRTHGITSGEMTYQITSTHHQMQYPYNLSQNDYDLLFITLKSLGTYYSGDKIKRMYIDKYGEPEIVLYHKKGLPKCLAVQGHPEMMPDSPVAKMIDKLVKDLVDENK